MTPFLVTYAAPSCDCSSPPPPAPRKQFSFTTQHWQTCRPRFLFCLSPRTLGHLFCDPIHRSHFYRSYRSRNNCKSIPRLDGSPRGWVFIPSRLLEMPKCRPEPVSKAARLHSFFHCYITNCCKLSSGKQHLFISSQVRRSEVQCDRALGSGSPKASITVPATLSAQVHLGTLFQAHVAVANSVPCSHRTEVPSSGLAASEGHSRLLGPPTFLTMWSPTSLNQQQPVRLYCLKPLTPSPLISRLRFRGLTEVRSA